MQKNKTTYYQLILDQSGSMSSCLNETIEGFNTQLASIRSMAKEFPEQKFFVSLTKFSDIPHHLFFNNSTDELQNIDVHTYFPQGNTALLDTIGECIFRLKAEKQNEFEEDMATAVIVIITDGFENASRYLSYKIISKLIADLTATENFSFSFLGTTIESVEQAARMNISRQNTRRYDKENIGVAFSAVSESMSFYAEEKKRGGKPSRFFRDNDPLSHLDQKQ